MNRGILITAYASLKEIETQDGRRLPEEEELRSVYERCYGKERFVRFLEKGVCPETRWVEGSNYVDVNIAVDPRTKRVIMMGAMDNLVKGAAGPGGSEYEPFVRPAGGRRAFDAAPVPVRENACGKTIRPQGGATRGFRNPEISA